MSNIRQLLLICGGEGTRIKSIYKNTPKSLIKFNNKPFIDYQINWIIKNKISNLYICTNKKSQAIIDYINKKKYTKININFSIEREKLGTGGAIYNLLKNKPTEINNQFYVMYGDSFLIENIKNQKIKNSIDLMYIYKNNNKYDTSNVEINKDIKTIVYDKFNIPMNPTHIDYGISCINKNNFIKYSKNKPKNFDLAQYLNYLSKKKMLYFIETKKKFYEVGSFQGIKNFKNFINKNDL